MSNSSTLYLVGTVSNRDILSTGVVLQTNTQGQNIPTDLKLVPNEDEMIAYVFSPSPPDIVGTSVKDYLAGVLDLDQQIRLQNESNGTNINPNTIVPLLRESSGLIRVVDGKDPCPNAVIDMEAIDFSKGSMAYEAFLLQSGDFQPLPIQQPLLVPYQQVVVAPLPSSSATNTPSSVNAQHVINQTPHPVTPKVESMPTPKSEAQLPRTMSRQDNIDTYQTPSTPTPLQVDGLERNIIRISSQQAIGTPMSSVQTPLSSTFESSMDQFSNTDEEASAEKKKRKKEKKEKKEKRDKEGSEEKKKKRKKDKKDKEQRKEKKKRKKEEAGSGDVSASSIGTIIRINQFQQL